MTTLSFHFLFLFSYIYIYSISYRFRFILSSGGADNFTCEWGRRKRRCVENNRQQEFKKSDDVERRAFFPIPSIRAHWGGCAGTTEMRKMESVAAWSWKCIYIYSIIYFICMEWAKRHIYSRKHLPLLWGFSSIRETTPLYHYTLYRGRCLLLASRWLQKSINTIALVESLVLHVERTCRSLFDVDIL